VRSLLIVLTILLAAAAIGIGYHYATHTSHSGSTIDVFTASQLDPSTPDYQNGLRLVQIDRVSQNALPSSANDIVGVNTPSGESAGLFFELPEAPTLSEEDIKSCGFQSAVCAQLLTVTGHTPNGDAIDLPWRLLSPSSRKMVFCRIPAGYPPGAAYIDVDASDWNHRHARWRIIGLPHTLRKTEPTIRAKVEQDGLQVAGVAGVAARPDPITGRDVKMLLVNLNVQTSSHSRRILSCETTAVDAEWTPAGRSEYTADTMQSTPYLASHYDFVRTVETGWPGSNSYAHVAGRIVAYDAIDEATMFHDVRITIEKPDTGDGCGPVGHLVVTRDQTVITPTGVKVMLPAQDIPNTRGRGITFQLAYSQNSQVVLQASPLYHWHDQPIDRVVAYMQTPISVVAETPASVPGRTDVMLEWPGAPDSALRDFPIIFRQELQTASCPFDLTLPVTAKYESEAGTVRHHAL